MTKRIPFFAFILTFTLAFVTALASPARAQQSRAVVMEFTGYKGEVARSQVVRAISAIGSTVSIAEVREARSILRSSGLDETSAAGRALIARNMRVDFIVWGRVVGRGAKAKTLVQVAGADGQGIGARTANAPGTSSGNTSIRVATLRVVKAALAQAPQRASTYRSQAPSNSGNSNDRARPSNEYQNDPSGSAPQRDDRYQATQYGDEYRDSYDRRDYADSPSSSTRGSAPRPQGPDEASNFWKREDKPDDFPEQTPTRYSASATRQKRDQATTRATRPEIMTLVVGVGLRLRSFEVAIEGDDTRTYNSGIYPELWGHLELRPAARSSKRGARGLALEGDFAMGLSVTAERTNDPGTPSDPADDTTQTLDVLMWRGLGSLGYFIAFSGDRTELGVLGGFGMDSFDISNNPEVAGVLYSYGRGGIALRHFIKPRSAYLRLDAGFRLPLSYGELSQTFGPTSGFGADGAITIGGRIPVGFMYSLRVGAEYYRNSFAPFVGGVPTTTPGGSTAPAQGSSMSDFGVSGHFAIGWGF